MKSISKNPEAVEGKIVIIRTDYNVPIIDGKIVEKYRIEKSIDTIKYVLDNNASKIVIVTHRGRPTGNEEDKKRFTLYPIKEFLENKLKEKISFIETGEEKLNRKIIERAPNKIIMLENIRFYKGETENNEMFAKRLASLGDVFINDAFSVSHRAHASIVGIAKFLPSFSGLWLEKEIEHLEKIKNSKPITLVLGGAKIKTKLPVIENLMENVDHLLVGGLIVFAFINSPYKFDQEIVEKVASIKKKYNNKIVLPIDFRTYGKKNIAVEQVNENVPGLDIGEKTIEIFREKIKKAKNIFWNGPMGKYEEGFYEGSEEIAKAIASGNAYSVVGGGDTLPIIEKYNLLDKFSFVSTGGGAALHFLAGKVLPGLEVLGYSENKEQKEKE